MSSNIIDLGIGPLTDDQLEGLVSTVEEKLNGHIQKHSHWQLLTDFNFIVNLSFFFRNPLVTFICVFKSGYNRFFRCPEKPFV